MNVFTLFTAHVRSAIEALAAAGTFPHPPDLERIVVEPPRDPAHGDLATNAAMALAKDAGLKPRDLASRLAAELGKPRRQRHAPHRVVDVMQPHRARTLGCPYRREERHAVPDLDQRVTRAVPTHHLAERRARENEITARFADDPDSRHAT